MGTSTKRQRFSFAFQTVPGLFVFFDTDKKIHYRRRRTRKPILEVASGERVNIIDNGK